MHASIDKRPIYTKDKENAADEITSHLSQNDMDY